jgi:copper chaperone CopZ
MGSAADSEIIDRIIEIKTELSSVKTILNVHASPDNNTTKAELDTLEENLKKAIKEGKDEQKTAVSIR